MSKTFAGMEVAYTLLLAFPPCTLYPVPDIHQSEPMNMSRRNFVNRTAFGMLSGAALSAGQAAESLSEVKHGETPLLVSTWDFGKGANDAGLKVLLQGGTIMDAVEQGIWVVESSGNGSVGLSGGPNAAGAVQLDACIMSGPGHRAGSVAGVRRVWNPSTLTLANATKPGRNSGSDRRRNLPRRSPTRAMTRLRCWCWGPMAILRVAARPVAWAASCPGAWATRPSSAAGFTW